MQVCLCCLVSKISHDKMPKHGREEEQGNMIWVRIWMNTSCPSLLVDFLATVFGEWDVRDGAEAALGGIEVGLNLPQFDRLNASEKTTSKDLTLPSGVIKHGWKIYQFDDFPQRTKSPWLATEVSHGQLWFPEGKDLGASATRMTLGIGGPVKTPCKHPILGRSHDLPIEIFEYPLAHIQKASENHHVFWVPTINDNF